MQCWWFFFLREQSCDWKQTKGIPLLEQHTSFDSRAYRCGAIPKKNIHHFPPVYETHVVVWHTRTHTHTHTLSLSHTHAIATLRLISVNMSKCRISKTSHTLFDSCRCGRAIANDKVYHGLFKKFFPINVKHSKTSSFESLFCRHTSTTVHSTTVHTQVCMLTFNRGLFPLRATSWLRIDVL